MKIIKSAFICLSALLVMSYSFADALPETSIKQKVEGNLHEGISVESVIKTPYSGLYEVRTTNGEILYADKEAKYLFIGRIVNTATMEDYT
ncbi:MAG: disulfide isomerase DsbC N-terminal domain-containing protein, partial [Burkholderiaceae bacterium]